MRMREIDMPSNLISPYGGRLQDSLVTGERLQELLEGSRDWPSWNLSADQLCDLELLLSGALSPLGGYLCQQDYEGVCQEMRLVDGTLWPLPITLDVTEEAAAALKQGDTLALRDQEGVMLAALHVEELWRPDLRQMALHVYGTPGLSHPGLRRLVQDHRPMLVGGRVEGIRLPRHYDFSLLRHSPAEARQIFTRRGWRKITGFATRNPMHRVHVLSTRRAARESQTNLFIQPSMGMGDLDEDERYCRVRSYQAVLSHYPRHTAMLSLLPYCPRLAGPREALLQGIIRRNYGCTHFMVGPHQNVPAEAQAGQDPYEAQEVFARHQQELGIELVPIKEYIYVHALGECLPEDEVPEQAAVLRFAEADFKERLTQGKPIPDWFSLPEVVSELKRAFPPRHKQGFTVFFCGLSGAGKSTIANVLLVKLMELGGRPVTLLDGDIVRHNLSSELTFSKEHRDINIRRIGFVASEITKNGGIAICAPIAPYDSVRKDVRQVISARGGFILVHVATPLAVCEQRDRKGMYAKARAGIIKQFTGISDPFEDPPDAEVFLDTSQISPVEATQQLLLYLEKEGYIEVKGE